MTEHLEQVFVTVMLGLPALAVVVFLRSEFRGRGGLPWSWGWVALWLAGLTVNAEELEGVSRLGGALFALLLVLGALDFAQIRRPRWLVPLGVGYSVVSGLVVAAGSPNAAFLVAAIVDSALFAWAAWIMLPRRPAISLPKFMLCGAHVALVALNLFEMIGRVFLSRDVDLVMLLLWVALCFTLGTAQALVLAEDARWQRDASDRKALERQRELALERATLRAAFESSPDGYIVSDVNGRIVQLSSAAALHLGLEHPAAWTGRHLQRLGADVRSRLVDGSSLDVMSSQLREDPRAMVRQLELQFEPPRGRTLLVFSSPIHGENRESLGRVTATRDVSEERTLESDLRQAQKMETLGNLAGGVAHDFNNQLVAILGNVELAGLSGSTDLEEHLDCIKRSALHCSFLTQSLLSFGRRSRIEVVSADANALARDTFRLLHSVLPRSIRLEVDLPSDAPWVRTDPNHLQQILTNLCVNARDAVGRNGTVVVRVRPIEVASEEIPPGLEVEPGHYVCFEVEDDGAGISPALQQRIFEPFFTTKGPRDGTGLGLAVVHGLVHALSGWVTVDSAEGRGTTFKVFLPSAQRNEERSDSIALDLMPAGAESVLLVDDEQEVRAVMRQVLTRKGYRLLEAQNGAEALAIYRERMNEIDLVLMDVVMPTLDGWSAAAAMRDLCEDQAILLTSGNFGPGRAPVPGIRCLPKPFRALELLSQVRCAIDRGNRMQLSESQSVGIMNRAV